MPDAKAGSPGARRRPLTVLVTYRPKRGREARFLSILKRHWPALSLARLVTPARPRILRATDKRTGRTFFVEVFSWKDKLASDAAHRSPEVLRIWSPMEPLLESMEIAMVTPVAPPLTRRSRPRATRRRTT